MVAQVGQLIREGVFMRVLEAISDEDKAIFTGLLQKIGNNEEVVYGFIAERVGNLEEMIREEIDLFKKESIEFMGLSSDSRPQGLTPRSKKNSIQIIRRPQASNTE